MTMSKEQKNRTPLDNAVLVSATLIGSLCFAVYGTAIGVAITGVYSPVFGVAGFVGGVALARRVLFRD